MFTDLEIINLGLSKLGSSTVSRIDPPRTSLERHVATGYKHWKRSEISKRIWNFALETDYVLTQTEVKQLVERPYIYALPTDCLRPIREDRSDWRQVGRALHDKSSVLKIDYLRNALEADFDPMFVEVLACRIAVESVEYVTQSNTKKADVMEMYREAVKDAGRLNAFVQGPKDTSNDDEAYDFVIGRVTGHTHG